MLFDNTTIQGSWVDNRSMIADFTKFQRIVNNVSMSMPHAGVFAAARDEKNGIVQPSDLAGIGEYAIRAAVPSPTVNVLCVNMKITELVPIVYTEWDNSDFEDTTIPGFKMAPTDWEANVPPYSDDNWLNKTVVDDIFEWGEEYTRRPPIFPTVSQIKACPLGLSSRFLQ